jgi:hypothetical protein
MLMKRSTKAVVYVGNSLVDMDVLNWFNMITMKDMVAWSATTLAHVKCGKGSPQMLQAMCCYPTSKLLVAAGSSLKYSTSETGKVSEETNRAHVD